MMCCNREDKCTTIKQRELEQLRVAEANLGDRDAVGGPQSKRKPGSRAPAPARLRGKRRGAQGSRGAPAQVPQRTEK